MKILITAGKSALAQKLLKAFNQDMVVLADYGEMPNFSTSNRSFISMGEKNEDTIAHTLLNHCLNEGVELILPLHAFEILPVAIAKVLFNEFNIELLLPNVDDLSAYCEEEGGIKPENWMIVKENQVLFSSSSFDQGLDIGKTTYLSGAFYFNESDVANLRLITI